MKKWKAEVPKVWESHCCGNHCADYAVEYLCEDANREIDRLHRRLWEKRKEALLAKMLLMWISRSQWGMGQSYPKRSAAVRKMEYKP